MASLRDINQFSKRKYSNLPQADCLEEFCLGRKPAGTHIVGYIQTLKLRNDEVKGWRGRKMCYMMRSMNEKILRQQEWGLEGEDCRNIEGGD